MADVRWLNSEEQNTWRAFLAVSRQVHESLDRQLQRDVGMPHAYYAILVHLSESPHRTLSMTDLAERTGFSPSRLSHAMAKLEKQGWAARGRSPSCGRTTVAELTDEGHAVLGQAACGHVAEVRTVLFDRLTREEQRQLGRICEKLLPSTCEPSEDCPPSDG